MSNEIRLGSVEANVRKLKATQIPLGGSAGQYLKKNSNSDYDYVWSTVTTSSVTAGLTAGGTAGQVLAKIDATDYNCNWITLGAGTGDMILANVQTVTGLKTFNGGKFALNNVANTIASFFTNTNAVSRTYTLKDASGTLAFTSDITGTNSGTNTGDQTITLTGGVTGSGTGSFTATLIGALRVLATNLTLPANYCQTLNRKYTINSGVILSLGSGAIVRIL